MDFAHVPTTRSLEGKRGYHGVSLHGTMINVSGTHMDMQFPRGMRGRPRHTPALLHGNPSYNCELSLMIISRTIPRV